MPLSALPSSPAHAPQGVRRAQLPLRRVVPLALATLALHALALGWLSKTQERGNGRHADSVENVVSASLAPAAPVKTQNTATPAPAATPTAAPKPPARARLTPAAAPAEAAVLPPAMGAPAPVAQLPAMEEAPVLAQLPTPTPLAEAAPANVFRVSLPPPVTIRYDLEKRDKDGGAYSGNATIHWRPRGERYRIEVDAGVLFITALSSSSEGRIGGSGIEPELYSEKPFRRARMDTHFQRERRELSFSAAEKILPLQGGEQDRASIAWQLAGMARGDSGKIVAGARLDLFVAGVRDGEVWVFQVAGEEELELGPGRLRAWHLARNPPAGSQDEKMEIWLAPDFDWYPVRIRKTEVNGDVYDMRLKNLRAPRIEREQDPAR